MKHTIYYGYKSCLSHLLSLHRFSLHPVSLMQLFQIILVLSLSYAKPALASDYNLMSQADLKGKTYSSNNETKTQTIFSGVTERLIKDGFPVNEIWKIYNNPKVSLELQGVSLFFVHSESKANYEQFLSDSSISKAVSYINQHDAELDNAQSIYEVDKTIITAIMLVETRLGTYLGNREVINILSTMSALSDTTHRERLWNFLPYEKRISREKFDKKADSKSEWAFKELKAFLKYTARENIDPVEIKGSYAGALGIAQFMPSNALTIAKDGNLDGKVDLFNHADAINSIANYLKQHGWKSSLNREQAYKVIYTYNHSTPYVETILNISDRLKN